MTSSPPAVVAGRRLPNSPPIRGGTSAIRGPPATTTMKIPGAGPGPRPPPRPGASSSGRPPTPCPRAGDDEHQPHPEAQPDATAGAPAIPAGDRRPQRSGEHRNTLATDVADPAENTRRPPPRPGWRRRGGPNAIPPPARPPNSTWASRGKKGARSIPIPWRRCRRGSSRAGRVTPQIPQPSTIRLTPGASRPQRHRPEASGSAGPPGVANRLSVSRR